MAFLNFIFITILVLYVLSLVARFALRSWLNMKSREFTERFGGNAGQQNRGAQPKEGEVKIQQTTSKEKRVSKSVGDYVEYEEVDDKCGEEGTEKN